MKIHTRHITNIGARPSGRFSVDGPVDFMAIFAGFTLKRHKCRAPGRRAFTLIEMLMVIAIIGILAALVIQGVKHASTVRKRTMVTALLKTLESSIDAYHAAVGSYPPDNGWIAVITNKDTVGTYAQTNQLFYELLGATNYFNQQNTFVSINSMFDGSIIDPADPKTFFQVDGIRNSLAGEAKSYYTPPPQTNRFKPYGTGAQTTPVMGFIVPVDLTPVSSGQANWWHYDASSIFRHNKESYDLWAVYDQGGTLETNGNWTQ